MPLDVPPVASVPYQFNVPLASFTVTCALNGSAVAFKQYDVFTVVGATGIGFIVTVAVFCNALHPFELV